MKEMFQELGQEGILIIATDGSFTPGSMRAGWGFAAFLDGKLIAERCGATTLYTSSTRMELEAVKQALGWLAQESPDVRVVVFATDSMAILQKIKNGWLPGGWREVEPYLNDKSPTFTYVPGHAGVQFNVTMKRQTNLQRQQNQQTRYRSFPRISYCYANIQHARASTSLSGTQMRETDFSTSGFLLPIQGTATTRDPTDVTETSCSQGTSPLRH